MTKARTKPTVSHDEIPGQLWTTATKLSGLGQLLKAVHEHSSPMTSEGFFGIGVILVELAEQLNEATTALQGEP